MTFDRILAMHWCPAAGSILSCSLIAPCKSVALPFLSELITLQTSNSSTLYVSLSASALLFIPSMFMYAPRCWSSWDVSCSKYRAHSSLTLSSMVMSSPSLIGDFRFFVARCLLINLCPWWVPVVTLHPTSVAGGFKYQEEEEEEEEEEEDLLIDWGRRGEGGRFIYLFRHVILSRIHDISAFLA